MVEKLDGEQLGLFCAGGTCEFDDVVVFATDNLPDLSGPLYCYQCTGVIWPAPSRDWCRCCQYNCANETAGYGTTRQQCIDNIGFCSKPNFCQGLRDIDRGTRGDYCVPRPLPLTPDGKTMSQIRPVTNPSASNVLTQSAGETTANANVNVTSGPSNASQSMILSYSLIIVVLISFIH